MDTALPTIVLPRPVRRLLEERLTSTEFELPFLPATAAEVLALCNEESCDARQLSETVERDQSLAGHILRVSNSVAYAAQEPIVSLQQAISRLGTSAIHEIAVAVSLKGNVFNVSGYQVKIRQMWMHSAATAIYARETARIVRHNVEGAYMCGLLHDVGKPLVMQALIDVARKRTERPIPSGLLDAAMDEFHEPLGARLAVHWRMPEWVIESVANHHHYERADFYVKEAMITNLADKLANWALDESRDESDFPSEDYVLDDLGLYGEDLAQLFELRENVIEVAEGFLQ